MNKELLPFESESLSRKELNELIAVTEENGHIRKKHRPVLPIAAAIIAVTAVSSVGVYAAVTKGVIHKASVENYYDSEVVEEVMTYDISELIEEQVSENEHFRVTVESLLTDDMTVNMIVTVEALDEIGSAYINPDINGLSKLLPRAYAFDTNGKLIDMLDTQMHGDVTDENYTTRGYVIETPKDRLNGAEEIYIRLFETSYREGDEMPSDVYSGIEFKVKIKPTLKTYTFAADNGYEVRMSQFQFYRMDVPDVSGQGTDRFVIHYSSGETEENPIFQFGYKKYDVEQIESIEFEGYTFYPKK